MASYVVMQGPRPQEIVFIRDGFAWLAFLLPVPWLLWHRLWIEAALALAATVLLSGLGEWSGLGLAASLLSILVSLFCGLEAAQLRVCALSRRDWQEWGVIDADRLEDAELVYAAEAADTEFEVDTSAGTAPSPTPHRPIMAQAEPVPSLGLVPYAGR